MQKGTGWKPSQKDVSSGPVQHLLAMSGAHHALATAKPSAACDRRALIEIKDQSITSCCVGFADAQSVTARRKFLRQRAIDAGQPDPGAPRFIAPFSIYTGARALARKAYGGKPSDPLTDEGCEPSMALESMGMFGVTAWDDWPFDEAKVNDEPDPLELRKASQDILVKLYNITSKDPAERERLMAIAIDQGHFPVFGTEVGATFEGYTSGILGVRKDKSEGGHMLGVCGHMPDPRDPGAKLFWLWNHWGTSWGIGGFAQVDRSFIGDPSLGDIAILHVQD